MGPINMKLIILAIALFASGSYALTCGIAPIGGTCGSGSMPAASLCLVSGTAQGGIVTCDPGTCGQMGLSSGQCATVGGTTQYCIDSDQAQSATKPSNVACPEWSSSVGRTATVSFVGLFLALIAFYLN